MPSTPSTTPSPEQVWTVGSILEWIEGYLGNHNDANPRLSAQWLIADALGCSRIQLYANLDRPLTEAERDVLRDYTRRRAAGEPLQYITGSTDFRFLTLQVVKDVLIPRPETEVLVSEALAEVKARFPWVFSDELPQPPCTMVDVCTGSGNIALSLASEVPSAHVLATDVSPAAVALARRNAETLDLTDRVEVFQGDLTNALPPEYAGTCCLVVSNPPYIPTAVLPQLDTEVTAFEPKLALDGGPDGLGIYRRLLPVGFSLLCEGGVLAVELHETSLDQAAQEAHEYGYSHVRIVQDLAGKPRILVAVRP